VREVFNIFSNRNFKLLSLDDYSQFSNVDIAETGKTFQENAFLKARYFATNTGLLTIGDDSGLVVDVLDGFPGVSSNRWLEGSDEERNLSLLKKLTRTKNRSASFVTALCLFDPVNKNAQYFEGRVEGKIALKQEGKFGFGYDPIFIPDGLNQTFGQQNWGDGKSRISPTFDLISVKEAVDPIIIATFPEPNASKTASSLRPKFKTYPESIKFFHP